MSSQAIPRGSAALRVATVPIVADGGASAPVDAAWPSFSTCALQRDGAAASRRRGVQKTRALRPSHSAKAALQLGIGFGTFGRASSRCAVELCAERARAARSR